MKYIFFAIVSLLICCRKFVQVAPPVTSLVSTSVFTNNLTASAAVSGLLHQMAAPNTPFGGGENGISILLGLSSDEFALFPTTKEMLALTYTNALHSNMNSAPRLWNNLYNYIYQANAVITGLEQSDQVSTMLKQQLIGEAKFIRALCHLYLVNIYGDVPVVTTTDYRINAFVSRIAEKDVYKQIINDLLDAKALLTIEYRTPLGGITNERVRPNKAAAAALLARVYLFTEDWVKAEDLATKIINNEFGQFSLSSNFATVFTKASSEAIFQLQGTIMGANTADAGLFLLTINGGPSSSYPLTLNDALISQFDLGDLRRQNWVNSKIVGNDQFYFSYKYKLFSTPDMAPNEYPILLRLAEQYLIRAEARAKQNNLPGAISDINIIKNRAGLLPIDDTLGNSQVVGEIIKERQLELFTEYGHRWIDLKRLHYLDSVMTHVTFSKGGTWHPYSSLYPIPIDEIDANPNLVQNPGY